MVKCKFCGKEFKSKKSLDGHLNIHSKELMNEPYKLEIKGLDPIILDVTKKEVEELRKNLKGKCMICGKTETTNTHPGKKINPNKLSVDHLHNSNHFRGLLCTQCNRNLGWYEKYQKSIIEYLKP